MRFSVRASLVLICSCGLSCFIWAATSTPAVDGDQPSYKLLLTPQRLRRLQRDRERQTIRWQDFDARVQSSPDSPQRGFELALYYAVTHDGASGRAAIQWGLAHACDRRQAALILDWCRPLLTAAQRDRLANANCGPGTSKPSANSEWQTLRDRVYLAIATGQSNLGLPTGGLKDELAKFADGGFRDPKALYALCELIDGLRINGQDDIRKQLPDFFMHLPAEFLLAMKPAQLEQPGWEAPIAALALVGIDPNLQASQFLQGWAIEGPQLVQEGPGVAYEFLWGDPYLPGISFENLDPWYYGQNGRLFARTTWEPDACWIEIEPGGKLDQNQCPSGWMDKTTHFGRMQMIPLTAQCIQVPIVANGSAVILWTHKAGQKVSARMSQRPIFREADASGLLQVPAEVNGKVCISNR
ncbi:MAG TPA: hypothetical protein VG168_07740 [Bryobacteraceae bacterium]|nr:hypothetical protein [Bryobacteraceae bacterium]